MSGQLVEVDEVLVEQHEPLELRGRPLPVLDKEITEYEVPYLQTLLVRPWVRLTQKVAVYIE